MRRRTARHARPLESLVKLMVFSIADAESTPIYCAIPMDKVRRVLNKGLHLDEVNSSFPRLDLSRYAFNQALVPDRAYTLLLELREGLLWGLQIPALPTLVNVPEQSIKSFSSEDNVHPMRSVLNQFVTLTESEPAQTLFLLDLDRLSTMSAI